MPQKHRIITLVAALGATVALTLGASSTGDAADGWLTDFEAAKKKAKTEGKDLLIDFTGSDWCGFCIKLHKQVFSKPEFKSAAPKHFVLVELDFPKRKVLDAKLRKQNQALKRTFAVSGYPTVYLTDADGRPYARTGYRPNGVKEYLEHLDQQRAKRVARDELFARARKVKGLEGARLLDQALTLVKQSMTGGRRAGKLVGYEPIFEEIIAFDKDDKGGLRSKYELLKGLEVLQNRFSRKDYDGVIEEADRLLKVATTPAGRQKILFFKAYAHYNKSQHDEAIRLLEAAIEASPKSQQVFGIKRALKQIQSARDKIRK